MPKLEETHVIKFRRKTEIMARLMREDGYDAKTSDNGETFYLDVRHMKEGKLERLGKIRTRADSYKWRVDIYQTDAATDFREYVINMSNAFFGPTLEIEWDSKTS